MKGRISKKLREILKNREASKKLLNIIALKENNIIMIKDKTYKIKFKSDR